jgi:hypothetical protein
VEGVGPDEAPSKKKGVELLYIRCFDEGVVTIDTRDTDPSSPRFRKPTAYSIIFQEEGSTGQRDASTTLKVHWTRCVHIADNRHRSEVLGTPRMQVAFDRLRDHLKVLAGGGEMFWKGAFPGFSFELQPGVDEIDSEAVRQEFDNYQNGLQRYLALTGLTAKSLAPQIGDPTSHYNVILQDLSIALGIPLRVLKGSEEAKLASSQDIKTWNKRLARRQEDYISPMVIRPFVDRLIAIGVLPEPSSYTVFWPDLNAPSNDEKAKVALVRTQALAAYLNSGADQLIPPEEYLTLILGLDPAEVEQVMKAAEVYQGDLSPQMPAPTLPMEDVEDAEDKVEEDAPQDDGDDLETNKGKGL